MNTTQEYLVSIRSRVQQLLRQQALLLKENEQLREEVKALRTALNNSEETANELKQRLEVRNLMESDMNDAEKKQLEKRLNLYLREIDRCIAMLGQ